jgi:voltage-gated potassium channel Kch
MMETSKSYLVLGRGDVGFAVVSMLRCPAKFTIIERDFSSTEVLKRAGIERADTVIITVRDFPTTERTLKAISDLKARLGIKPHVLAVVFDENEVPEAKRLGADEALLYSQVMADFVLARLGS